MKYTKNSNGNYISENKRIEIRKHFGSWEVYYTASKYSEKKFSGYAYTLKAAKEIAETVNA